MALAECVFRRTQPVIKRLTCRSHLTAIEYVDGASIQDKFLSFLQTTFSVTFLAVTPASVSTLLATASLFSATAHTPRTTWAVTAAETLSA